nr:endonuclease/exonuclease/phosphatase family protein [Kineosporia mesophila]
MPLAVVILTAVPAIALPGRRRFPVVLALVGIAVTLPGCGLNPAVLAPRRPVAEGDGRPGLSVVSWNTEYWHQTDDPARFYAYLTNRDADVYLLQEYLHVENGVVLPINDLVALRRHFPRYRIFVSGELVTLVRDELATAKAPVQVAPDVLRVDVRVPDGQDASIYNVHIPAQLDPGLSPLSGAFYRTLNERDRSRRQEYRALTTDLRANTRPTVVAGDFNTSSAMGDLRSVRDLATDAGRVSRSLYPVSWSEHRPAALRLWRLDWTFLRNAEAEDYRLESAEGMSDHALQAITVRVGAR